LFAGIVTREQLAVLSLQFHHMRQETAPFGFDSNPSFMRSTIR